MAFSGTKIRKSISGFISLSTTFSILLTSLVPDAAIAKDRKKTAYGEAISYYKEEISSVETEIERAEKEIKDLEKKKAKLDKWDDLDPDDPLVATYSERNCFCGYSKCTTADLTNNGIPLPEMVRTQTTAVYTKTVTTNPAQTNTRGVVIDPKTGQPVQTTTTTTNPAQTTQQVPIGYEQILGPPSYKLDMAQMVQLCTTVYEIWSDKRGNFSPKCKEAAKNCGPNRRDYDARKIPADILALKEKIKELKEKRKELIAERRREVPECPTGNCAVYEDEKYPGGSKAAGILQGVAAVGGAVAPMVMAGIGAGMYNKYLNKSLEGYNAYLSNSLQMCNTYTAANVTMGIPTNPCPMAQWGGGGYGMGAGFGMGASFGMPGAFGLPGGFQGGYPGVIGNAFGIGSAFTGSFQGGMSGFGAFQGGMMPAFGMGSFQGGMMPGFGGYQGGTMGYPAFGMGSGPGMFAPGMMGFSPTQGFGAGGTFGYPSFGMGGIPGAFASGIGFVSSIGSPGFNMSFGMGTPGMGYPGYGMPGIGGYGMQGSFAGFSAGTFGAGYGGGMMGGMGYGMPMDPSYLLNAQRQAMFSNDMMIAQQQVMEAQLRAQQAQQAMYYGMGGGYGYGMGMGFGFGGYGFAGSYGGVPTMATPGINGSGSGNTF